MVKILFIRGAPATGKTTITKAILKELKKKYKLNCAYICEDDFRKQMQFKYKARDLTVHENSVELIKTIILKLCKIDFYDLIFIEGQFRYKSILDKYEKFVSKNNFDSILFQFELNLEDMKKRDIKLRNIKSQDIEEIKKDIDSYIPNKAIIIHTKKLPEKTIKEVIKYITN